MALFMSLLFHFKVKSFYARIISWWNLFRFIYLILIAISCHKNQLENLHDFFHSIFFILLSLFAFLSLFIFWRRHSFYSWTHQTLSSSIDISRSFCRRRIKCSETRRETFSYSKKGSSSSASIQNSIATAADVIVVLVIFMFDIRWKCAAKRERQIHYPKRFDGSKISRDAFNSSHLVVVRVTVSLFACRFSTILKKHKPMDGTDRIKSTTNT